MRNIAIVDETFDINITESYHLSVQLSSDGLSFAVLDTVRKKYIALKNLLIEESHHSASEDQVRRLLQTDNYLNRKYKSAGLIFATSSAALIPNALYDQDRQEELYRFSNHLPGKHNIVSHEIACVDARVIFALPKAILDALENSPNNFHILHQSGPMIENAFLEAKGKASEILVSAQIFPNFFDITVFKNGKIELYNSFDYKTDQDFIFYILYVYEQFGLNPDKISLSLSGQVEKHSKLITSLLQFLPNINFEEFNRNFTYSYTFGQLNQHQFTNLINLYRCV